MSLDTKRQVIRIYNDIPELTHTEIQVRGKGEERLEKQVAYHLSKERVAVLLKFIKEIGVSAKHLQLLFKKNVSILLFKPKGKLFLTEHIDATVANSDIEFSEHLAGSFTPFKSSKGSVYQFGETSGLRKSSQKNSTGNERIRICEAKGTKGAIEKGWVGASNIKSYKILVSTSLLVEDTDSHKKVGLAKGEKITLSVPVDSVSGDIVLQRGILYEGQLTWTSVEKALVYEKVEEIDDRENHTVLAEIKDTGYYRIIELVPQKSLIKHLKVALRGVADAQIYAYCEELDIVQTGYQHTSYINRYEFQNLDAAYNWIILVADRKRSSPSYYLEELNKELIKEQSVVVVETKPCSEMTGRSCWGMK